MSSVNTFYEIYSTIIPITDNRDILIKIRNKAIPFSPPICTIRIRIS